MTIGRLRELAEAATGSRWAAGFWPLPYPLHYVGALRDEPSISSRFARQITGTATEADAKYIAAADPATVLALVRIAEIAESILDERQLPPVTDSHLRAALQEFWVDQ